jgi:hypothetical protein
MEEVRKKGIFPFGRNDRIDGKMGTFDCDFAPVVPNECEDPFRGYPVR